MKVTIGIAILTALALAIGQQAPTSVDSAPTVHTDGPQPLTVDEFAKLQDALRRVKAAETELARVKDELANLKAALTDADHARVNPQPVAVSPPAATGTAAPVVTGHWERRGVFGRQSVWVQDAPQQQYWTGLNKTTSGGCAGGSCGTFGRPRLFGRR